MANYQNLLKGALSALARAQQELHPERSGEELADALRKAREEAQTGAYSHPAAAGAQDLYAGQGLSGLQLYHGSPWEFAPTDRNPLGEFDFLSNAGRGEGGQSFGPGSYLTGSRGLAEEYARRLSGGPPRRPRLPTSWQAGYGHDPEGFLEFLRARAVNKGIGYGLNPGGGNWMFRPTSIDSKWSATPGRVHPGFVTRVDLNNTDAYLDAMRSAEVPLGRGSPLAEPMKTDDAAKRSADLGRSLLNKGAVQDGPPQLSQRRIADPSLQIPGPYQEYETSAKFNRAREQLEQDVKEKYRITGRQMSEGPVNVVRNNLRAVQGAVGPWPSKAQPPKFRVNMSTTARLGDLNGLPPEPTLPRSPNIYTVESPTAPSELFSYDWPLGVSSPRVVDALGKAARQANMAIPTDKSFADMSGSALIHGMEARVGKAEAVKILREAGVPGMYFQRAGHRGSKASPEFDPANHNFVWFDDPVLNIKSREGKAHGGRV